MPTTDIGWVRSKMLHTKVVGDRRLALCLYEAEDGRHVYGVEENDVLVFTGTKAEAKERYGNWRKP